MWSWINFVLYFFSFNPVSYTQLDVYKRQGPGLTFAMREALFALAHIEKELLYGMDVETSNPVSYTHLSC